MKKSFLLIVLSLIIFSCKQENPENQLIRGEFILINDAAVIKGKDFIYGVELNDLATKLSEKVTPLKREEYDMVPVVVKGLIKPNPKEGWEEIVEIKEIVGVSAPTAELPAKIKSSDKKEEAPIEERRDEEEKKDEHNHEGHNH